MLNSCDPNSRHPRPLATSRPTVFTQPGSADCGEEAGGHPLDRVDSAIGVRDHGIAARQRGSVEMIDRQRVALQLKMNQMDQGPAHRQQWRFTSGGIEEIALAGRIEALDAVARVDL